MEFEVLYYKRTNKVHKSKGVSKVDGILTVQEFPKHFVTLRDASALDNDNDNASSSESESDDGGKNKKKSWNQKKKQKKTSRSAMVYSGVQVEIAKRAATLLDDDIIALGGYQVEIVGRRNKGNATIQRPGLMGRATSVLGKPKAALGAPRGLVRNSTGLLARKAVPMLSKKRAPIGVKMTPVPAAACNKAPSTEPDSDDEPTPTAPLRPRGLLQRRPLQSKSILASKNATNKGIGAKATNSNAMVKKRTLVNQAVAQTSKGAKSPKLSPTATVLPDIPLPAVIRKVLRPHQVQGVDFMWKCITKGTKGAIMADEMGLGKTLMTIAVICALHRQHRDKQFVVVCPSSLVTNWAKEFDKWIGRASQPKRVVIKKGGEEGLKQIRNYISSMVRNQTNQTGQVLIISYDLFRMNAAQFEHLNTTVGLLVVDEGHRLKNTSGSLTLTALDSLQSDARLCITATPIQNNLCEFYTLANFCCPGLFGDLSEFRRDYERPIAASNNKSASREQRLRGTTQSRALEAITKTFMLRRLQKEILKTMLPPRTEALLFCRPSQTQSELYRSITSKSQVTGSSSDALTTLTTLRKVCSHPFLYKEDDSIPSSKPVALSGKLVVLDGLLQSIRETAPDDKVVIVSNFTSALSIIESLVLKQRNYAYLRLDGSTDLQNRQPMVDSFNRSTPEKSFCLLLSSKAGGCGLNLVGANRLVMVDPDFNPANDVQAMGRVYRQGQTKPCTIYRLFTSGTVEEVIYQRQSQKGNLATLTVDGRSGQNSTSRFTKEEIADCFTLKEDCDCDTKSKLGSHWAPYDGPDSLVSQGCDDEPLLNIAETMSESLGFVHIVNDDDIAPVPAEETASLPGKAAGLRNAAAMKALYESDSEEEFESSNVCKAKAAPALSESDSDDDEYEF